IDGTRNVWVVKPGHGSRGRGVKCFDDLQFAMAKSCQIGSNLPAPRASEAKLVQKYVEPCLLLDEKKFDIRAWVLVTSWNPLTVWMYEPYIRLCTEKHSL
ncbi:tubulin-tyrosine ligase/Tubulin polyglutamylase, partial [Baffinella frigidus]